MAVRRARRRTIVRRTCATRSDTCASVAFAAALVAPVAIAFVFTLITTDSHALMAARSIGPAQPVERQVLRHRWDAFDRDTNRAGRGGEIFACDTLLDFPCVADSSCAWNSDALVPSQHEPRWARWGYLRVRLLDFPGVADTSCAWNSDALVSSDSLVARAGVINNNCAYFSMRSWMLIRTFMSRV